MNERLQLRLTVTKHCHVCLVHSFRIMSAGKQSDGTVSTQFELQKKFGVWSAIALLAGTMVGSGIFISPVGVLQETNGSVGLSLVIWAACGVVSLLAALCYVELGTAIRESGADFAYYRVAYGPSIGFIYVWTSVFVVRITGNAAVGITFGTYLVQSFFSGCKPPDVAVKLIGTSMILTLAFINYVSVKASAKVQNIFTAAKFLIMFVIVIGGLVRLAQGDPVGAANFENAFDHETLNGITFTQIGLAMSQGLFSYDGWNNLNYVVEEIKDSEKNLPRAILVAVPLVTGFYVLVNIAYLSVLTPSEMISSQSVAISFGVRVLGSFSWIIPVAVCLSTAGALNGSFISGGRLPFVAARQEQMPKIFEMIHVKYYTPATSILLTTFMTLIFMIPGNFDSLLYAFSFTAWLFYGLSAIAVLVMRYTKPNLHRPYKVPLIIPILVVLIALYLVIAPLVDKPEFIYLYAMIFMLCGFPVYYVFVYKKFQISRASRMTEFFQLLLEVAPTTWEEIKW